MISRRLALSGALAAASAAALAGATAWRVRARAARALAAHPPEGQLLTIGAQTLHAVVKGSGPDLVLIHGASGSSRDFTFALVERLATAFRVIAVDRPGLGHSSPLPDGDASLAGQVAVLKAAADALGAPRPLLVGQSYGGTVALNWALTHPAAALVTLCAPSLPWPGTLDPWYRLTSTALGRATLVPLAAAWVPQAYVRAQIDAVFAPDHPPPGYLDHLGTDLTLRAGQLAANVAQINALRPQVVAMEPHYPALSLPVEMVHGSADTIVPLAIHSGPLAPRLPSANLTVIDGAGHMPHHSHPDIVLAAIRRAAARAGLR
jgi:pimeloyl-ACP methyl ester carboxylesterase